MRARHVTDPALGRIVRDYGDHLAEARACRSAAALFDFSFLARARLEGPGALSALAALTPRPMQDLAPGRIRYCTRVNAGGHLVCDLTVWRHGPNAFEVMSGRHDDVAHLAARASPDCTVTDLSGQAAIFALQGPETLAALAAIADIGDIAGLAYFGFCDTTIAGKRCLVGRLGYTGEPGVEIVVARRDAPALWRALRRHARPAGFAAADILRLEAGFVLFANEFQVPVTPDEAGLDRFGTVTGPRPHDPLRLVALHLAHGPAPVMWRTLAPLARPAVPGAVAVTSACHSPLAGGPLGLGFARAADLDAGRPLHDAAGTFGALALAPLPCHDPGKARRLWPAARRGPMP